MRYKLSFLYVVIHFELSKCKGISKNCSLKCWLCFYVLFWRTQKTPSHHFAAPLKAKTFQVNICRKENFLSVSQNMPFFCTAHSYKENDSSLATILHQSKTLRH